MLLKVSNPAIMTELTEQEVRVLTTLKTIADEYDVKSLNTLINNYMLLKVSFKRQGRKEIIQVARPEKSSEEKMRKGLKSMVLGLK